MVKADAKLERIIGSWHTTHVDLAVAKLSNDLARSGAIAVFDEIDADIVVSKHGRIARQHRLGEVDFKALAIAELGEERVSELAEAYRKPASSPWVAPNAWSAEAGVRG